MNIIPFTKPSMPDVAGELKAALVRLEAIQEAYRTWRQDNSIETGSPPLNEWPSTPYSDHDAANTIGTIQEWLSLSLIEQCALLGVIRMKPAADAAESAYSDRDLYEFLKRRFSAPRIAEIGAALIRRATGTNGRRKADNTATARAASASAALQTLTDEDSKIALAVVGAVQDARRGDASSLRLAIVKLSRRVLPANDVAQLTVQLVRDMATWSSDKAEQAGA